MARRHRAAPPSAEALEARAEAKALERLRSQAVPGVSASKDDHKCSLQLYKVAVNRVVHGKRKGEDVRLCPHKGATQALVQSGHLVPTQPATAKAVTTSSPVVKSDDTKGADHG